MEFDYKLIRSNRKTLALQIKDRQLIVRAPLHASEVSIRDFVNKNREWIEKHMALSQVYHDKSCGYEKLSELEIQSLFDKAKAYIPERVRYYAPIVGVTYGKITIRRTKSNWGSCSNLGNLNFNCLLMLAPLEVIDSVIVHELCHRLEMNHSKRFYEHVLRVMPNYKELHGWLKKNGQIIMERGWGMNG